jgi:hypothetical protein
VRVYAAGQRTTTDVGGVYIFSDIPVESSSEIQITIAAPAGYLGATVTVAVEESIEPGFILSAETVILPQLNGTVKGKLKNSNTGETIVNTEVCLKFVSIEEQHYVISSENVSYATTNYCGNTDTSGIFTISTVPSDSILRYDIQGWNIVDGQDETVRVEDTVVTSVGDVLVY